MIRTNLILALIVAMTLVVSCSKSNVEDVSHKASTASFDATEVQAIKVDTIGTMGVGPWTEIPVSRSITFKGCLNDITLQVPLQDQNIVIETPHGDIPSVTNSNGCYFWDDDFAIDYFSKEKLVDYKILIKGLRGHHGIKTISLKVNPWAQSLAALVFDSRFNEVPLEVSSEELTHRERPAAFNITNVKTSYFDSGFDKDTQVPFYEFRLNASMEGRRLDLQGNEKTLPLDRGQFQLEVELIEKRNQSFHKLSTAHIVSHLSRGQMQENVKFYFSRGYQHHPDSIFYFKFNISPIGLPANLATDLSRIQEGILPLAGLQGSAEGTLESIKNFPLEMTSAPLKSEVILGDKEDDYQTPQAPQDDSFALKIARVQVKKGVLLPGDHFKSTARLRRMPVEICLADGLSTDASQPLRQTLIDFSVAQSGVKDTEEKRNPTTNIDGCFQSYIIVTYDYLACEQFYTLDYTIHIKEGRYQGLESRGQVAINPFNDQDLYYDLNQMDSPPVMDCEAPQLAIKSFGYKNQPNPRDGYLINKNLHLSLSKRYSFEFEPRFFRGSGYQEIQGHLPLFQGDVEVEAIVFSPKHSEVDYFNFNENEWDYLTTAKQSFSVNSNGVVAGELFFPFHLSETLFLSFKNLLRVTVKSAGNLNLKPVSFTVPFYALAQGATLNTNLTFDELSAPLREVVNKDGNRGFKIPGYHLEIAKNKHHNTPTPLELYRSEITRLGQESNSKYRFLYGDIDFFNNLPPLKENNWGKVSNVIKDEHRTTLGEADLRTLSTFYGTVPTKYLKKFCRLFYVLPVKNDRKTVLLNNRTDDIGGESIKDCYKNPEEHIELTPMSFVEKILRTEKVNEDGDIFEYVKARFIKDETGNIRRGNAFFAAYGDRSSLNWGERESEGVERSLSYGIEGPSMVFVGSSERHSKMEEVFKVKNTAEMRAAFNRNYTSRDITDLTFNSVTLQFPALKRDCITLRSKKGVPLGYNFCRKEAKLQRIREKWYFIGDTQMDEHGIISDGNVVGDPNRHQVIRGQQNFNLLWDQYETTDTLLVVKEVGTISVGDAFGKYINREKGLVPFENQYDHSFPGMILPYSHVPTSSCNGCEDP